MAYGFLDIAGTPSVKAAQPANGSGEYWAGFKGHRAFDRFTDAEAQFIAERDSFYMATVSETGWPYVQHRGGPPRIPARAGRQDAGLRRLPRQPAVHQRRQPRGQRPRRR